MPRDAAETLRSRIDRIYTAMDYIPTRTKWHVARRFAGNLSEGGRPRDHVSVEIAMRVRRKRKASHGPIPPHIFRTPMVFDFPQWPTILSPTQAFVSIP